MLFYENLTAFIEGQRQRLDIVSQAGIPEEPVEQPAILKAGQKVFFRFPQYVCP